MGKISETRFRGQPRSQPVIYFGGGTAQVGRCITYACQFFLCIFAPCNSENWAKRQNDEIGQSLMLPS